MTARHRTRTVIIAVVVILSIFIGLRAWNEIISNRDMTAVAVIGTVRTHHILGPRQFDSLGGSPGSEFGVTADKTIVFSAGGALHALTHPGSAFPRISALDITGAQPTSFALDSQGAMLAIANGYFGVLDENGTFTHSVPLPFDGMQLAPSVHAGAVYLYGGTRGVYRLYRFISDGTLQIILDSPVPIVAVADNEKDIFAATASRIMLIRQGAPEILFIAPTSDFAGPIRSLAVTSDGLIFFSTATRVYAILSRDALSVVNDAGGSLRVRDDILYLLDPRRKMLLSIWPASYKIFAGAAQ